MARAKVSHFFSILFLRMFLQVSQNVSDTFTWTEYCCHLKLCAFAIHLVIIDKIESRICNIIGPELASRLLSHRHSVSSLCLSHNYYYGNCSDDLSSLAPKCHGFKRTASLAARFHHFLVEISRCNRKHHANNFFCHISRLWCYLPAYRFLENFDL